MEKYENLGLVGEGSYGMVIKCKNKESGRIVAIKKFIDSEDDKHVKKIALREIRMLKQLRHDNLVNLLEVFRRKKRLYLVFEFVDNTILDDLEKYPNGIDELRTKRTLFQVIRGVEFCHLHNVGYQYCRFQLIMSCFIKLIFKYMNIYLCYYFFIRPIDIWAIGCLASEMLTGDPLFPGDSDIDQLHRIVRCLGNLSEKYQNIFHRNPLFVGMRVPFAREIDPLDKRLSKVSKSTIGFIKSCLRIDASDRPTSSALLRSEYFTRDNFASIFLEELKTLIKNETELYLPSSSMNNTGENKSVNITSITSQVKVKNDPTCKNNNNIDNNIGNPVQSKPYTTTTLITGTTTSFTSTNKLSMPESMNVKQQNYKDTTMNSDHFDLPVTPQADQIHPEVNDEHKNTLQISNDLSTNISCNTKPMEVEVSKPKCIITDEVSLRSELSTPSVAEKSKLCSEHLVHNENMDPHHLLNVMNVSKKHYGSNNVLNKIDNSDSRESLPVVEKINERLNEMPSIPQKSFGLLTTIKCQSPKPINSISKSSVLEDSSELLNDTDPSSVTLSISPIHTTNITSSEQSLLNSTNQSLSTSGLVTKIQAIEVTNEHTDCTSTVTETSVSKYSDYKSGDSQPKETISNKRLPYLTLTQTSNYHFLPQHHRGIYQTPPKSFVSDQTNINSTTTVSSGIGSSPMSPLLNYNQTFNKHENLPNFQSTNIPASTCVSSQTWTTQISSSSVSNSSKDSKGRRYYQPPNPNKKPTFSLQFPMNISHAVCQSVSTSIGNHYNNHSHHFSVLQPIGIMPSPNIFDTNHDHLHSEQTDLRGFIGQVNFSTRSPLQNLSQQNIFKKSFASTATTGTIKLDSTCSLTGNQHSFTPQILPAFTCSAYSTNQYGTNTKSNHTNQFPMSRLSKPDKFWLGSLPKR
ncbi:hypothetical protein MN116_001756 [Schistosoma mekongi]|uniref:cyclin-dependent kinase n=1 Tax=Schistosoma mekongi TaxID=38744 RepID=A0AAE1ZIA5_SCHME|nr:hypothetical protein MN116_001756 [Schistosoma mekongi]